MSEEMIIINDEPFYKIQNGTGYDYAPIPKQFKPYFEKLEQENQQLKEKVEWYEKENKHNQEIIIKDTKVLDEIREFLVELDDDTENTIYDIDKIVRNYLLQILDKVKQ